MLNTNITDLSSLDTLNSKVELYHNSTLIQSCTCADFLESFSMGREGDTTKFFGFGIVHKMQCTLIDINRVLTLGTGDTVKIAYGNMETDEWDYPYPTLYITECSRDEKSNSISFTAYDKLYFATAHTLDEIKNDLGMDYTVGNVAYWCAQALGLIGYDTLDANTALFSYMYHEAGGGVNFNGDEDLRTVLNYVAEFTGNIYFLGTDDRLKFKGLGKGGSSIPEITKDKYYELSVKEPAVLKNICSVTELGENLEPTTAESDGYIQYLKENPFLTAFDSVTAANLVQIIGDTVQGLTITQFDCDWEGNHLLEIGDKIGVVDGNGAIHYTYLLNDTLTYSGYLNQLTGWEYTQDNAETATNSTTLGDRLNETYARVNKLEKNITLYVGEVIEEVIPEKIEEATGGLLGDIADLQTDVSNLQSTTNRHTSNISQLTVTASNITSEVNSLKQTTTTLTDELGDVKATQQTIQEDISSLQVTTNGITGEVSTLKETTTNIQDDISEMLSSHSTIEEQVGRLQVQADSVTTTVTNIQTTLGDKADAGEVETLKKQVETKVTAEQVEFIVSSELSEGIDKVTTTSKKYTFDDDGLNVSSSGSNISTTISDDGMNIYRQGEEVLVANNEGVKAEDLHATTYLIIGNNSRFEDYTNNMGEARTACFWIGG